MKNKSEKRTKSPEFKDEYDTYSDSRVETEGWTVKRLSQLGLYPDDDPSLRMYLGEIASVPLLKPEHEVELAKRIEVGQFAVLALSQRQRMRDGRGLEEAETYLHVDVPDEEDETQTDALLEVLVEEGRAAKDLFIRANLKLVVHFATRYRRMREGVDLKDLISEGSIGLVRAVEGFDYSYGCKFSTYASYWIMREMGRACANLTRTIHIPVKTVEKLNQLCRCEAGFFEKNGRMPTEEELASVLDMDVEELKSLRGVNYRVLSLDTPFDTVSKLVDSLPSSQADPLEQVVSNLNLEVILRSARWAGLSERDIDILTLSYGLVDGEPRSSTELSEWFNLTPRHIRKLIGDSIEKIRCSPVARTYLSSHFRDK